MTAGIAQIQQAAKGGFARLDASGEWKTGGKGLGGRVVAWFIGIVSRGRVAKENRAAISQFIQAIGSDTRYGENFQVVAQQKLHHLSSAGKPLKEREVTWVLSGLEDLRVARDQMNHGTAECLSTTDRNAPSQRSPAGFAFAMLSGRSFISTLDEAVRMRGLSPQDINTDAAYVQKAAQDIKQRILAAGDNGKKEVSTRQASTIAIERIGKLANQLATLHDTLEGSGMENSEKQSLMQRLAAEPDLGDGRETILAYIHGGRINQLRKELPQMLSQAAQNVGVNALAGNLTLERGVDSAMVVRVSARLKEDFPNAIVPEGEIRTRLNTEISDYVANRKQLMDHVDAQLPMGSAAHTALCGMIAQEPSIKTVANIDAIIAAAPGYEAFCQSLSVGGTEAMAAAFVRYQKSFDQAMTPLMHEGLTVEELAPSRVHALSLWIAQQQDKVRDDPTRAADINRGMEYAHRELTGPAGDRWVDSTVWVAEQHRRVDSRVDDIARTVQNLRHALAADIGDYLGVPDDAPLTREGMAGNISSDADVSDNVYCMFRDLGVRVPPPELMGRSKAETYDDRFSEVFLKELNNELNPTGKKKDELTKGINSTMYRDLGRANFFIGEPGTVENEDTSARRQKGDEVALALINKFFGDDKKGKEAVTRVTNQSVFADLAYAESSGSAVRGYGPFSENVTRDQREEVSNVDYRIWREPDGSGYGVQVSHSAPVQFIMNVLNDGPVRNTDLATSISAFKATFRISRESIDEGNPRAELVTAPSYEYRINPAPDGTEES